MIAPIIDLGPVTLDLRKERWVKGGVRISVSGISGSGKSYLTSKMMEALHAIGIPFLCIDPDGEYRSLAQLDRVVVFGSREGDSPINKYAVMSEIFNNGNSVVVDISDLPSGEEQLTYMEIADLLLRTQRVNRANGTLMSIFFVVDEIHLFAPQKRQGDAIALEITVQIARRGRKHGIHTIFVSQRPGDLEKDVLSQSNCRFVGALEIELDFKAIKSIMPAGLKHSDLRALKTGHFYLSVGGDLKKLPRCSPRITKNLGQTPPIVGVQHQQVMMFVEAPQE